MYFFHGFPSSRLLAAFLHERAKAAGLALIASDRPGFGHSSPKPGRTILDWPSDVAALADCLGHKRFSVLGVSCGGPYALACAHELPHRVRRAVLVAGMGPMDVPSIRARQHPALKLMFALARIHPRLIAPFLRLDRRLYTGDVDKALRVLARMLTPPDRELLLAEPKVAADFLRSMADAYRQGIGAAQQEAALIAAPRGFRMSNIKVPVHVFQGDHDRHVPPVMGLYLADSIPFATWHRCPNDGHLSIVWNQFDEYARLLNGQAGEHRLSSLA